jgi:hypothetical protein
MRARAGSRAWAGLTHEAILEAVRGPWALAVPPGLPPVLQDLLLTALSKQPEHRCGPPVCARARVCACMCV